MHHRVFSCNAMADCRAKLVSKIAKDRAAEAGTGSLLCNRAIPVLPHWLPVRRLRDDPGARWEYPDGSIKPEDGDTFRIGEGDIYTDGSCYHSADKRCAHAGWAAVQVTGEGAWVRALYGCVPGAFGQSAVVAEHIAVLYAAANAQGDIVVKSDNSAVVDGFKSGYAKVAAAGKPQAGIWRELKMGGHLAKVQAILKVKAHRDIGDAASEADRVDILGNDSADTFAKKGASLHSAGWAATAVQDLQREVVRQGRVVIAIGNVLAQWPSARELWKRQPQDDTASAEVQDSEHLDLVPRAIVGPDDLWGAESGGQDQWEDEESACHDLWGDEGLCLG